MWRSVILAALLAVASSRTCIHRSSHGTGDHDGHFCVCNATYCDDAPSILRTPFHLMYTVVTSSKAGLRFHKTQTIYGTVSPGQPAVEGTITLNPMDRYQSIVGFGGGVTDAAGINIQSLSIRAANKLMRSYFAREGLEYNMLRTPMGGSDFSTRPYAYANRANDTSLYNFSLQVEDYMYKIPILRGATLLSNYNMKLMTAPWSANPWMKTNNTWTSEGKLRPEYRQLWADYFVKYFRAYADQGLHFWGLTPQNEPAMNTYLQAQINGMSWTAEEQRDWIIDYLEPTLRHAGLGYINIFIGDDNRQFLPSWPRTVMQNRLARDIVAGTAVHWYFDDRIPVDRLDQTKALFPEKLILYTEACSGFDSTPKVILGSWGRGERYARNIIENLSHWVSSWIDWNIALNLEGGPTYIGNFVDSPIIVNSTADEFYKQPMYYALGHFSKYIPAYSIRIGSTSDGLTDVYHVAFTTPDLATVLILLNTGDTEKAITVTDRRRGATNITVPAKSINTMKYW